MGMRYRPIIYKQKRL